MARIQVLPLPPVRVGEVETIPYLLVIDGADDDEEWDAASAATVRDSTGARGIIVSPAVLDVG